MLAALCNPRQQSPVGEGAKVNQPDNFQQRVAPWMTQCFGDEISSNIVERNHRFLEESLELVQAMGCTKDEAYQLVDYTFSRPVGDRQQEVGGVMVTLAALCLADNMNMHELGQRELDRIWTKIPEIRKKQAAKPAHSPLPQPSPPIAEKVAQGHPEDACEKCGGPNFTWFAPNELWNKYATEADIICPACFVSMAAEVKSAWKLTPEFYEEVAAPNGGQATRTTDSRPSNWRRGRRAMGGMMSQFANNTWFEIEDCCNCGMQFAMTADYKRERLKDRKCFYCPAGHPQHYTGPTEAQQLKDELERKQQMLQAAEARALTAEQDRAHVAKAHKQMRARIMNGVCPCCNRTFQNLMQHMQTQHPEFKEQRTIQVLRKAFAMTQSDVAREAGTKAIYVSAYERNAYLPAYAKQRIDGWLERHTKG